MKFKGVYNEARKSGSSILYVVVFYIFYKLFGKHILAANNTKIRGLSNIDTHGLVKIGLRYQGFMMSTDRTYLNIRGKLLFLGKFSISKGCRFDIGPEAKVVFGHDGYINANTVFIISHNLFVGDGCIISWNCQFLDDNFHTLDYPGKTEKIKNEIRIGNNVWIGSNCFIYKGTFIPDGCVIAANTIVKGTFSEPNCLIGGNPAAIIKRNVKWY